ncbi:Phosphatidylinositol transfer alpha isoform [Brachionus plicatilis]|uniref:Phosphatidylinositol transfer alpha isoform n=1 Tax=Brachionus plicatilis TaxID=10195 RepID=A0A3M7PIG6_BRAPC|nr:Phosphatidylinositol transfer alpha isoform [Brachionus plicatilis]
MKIIEYRILMPLTLEENLIGQLWSFSEISRENTGGGEGVEILVNSLFDLPLDSNGSLIYSKLPEYEDFDSQVNGSKKPKKEAKKDERSKSLERSDLANMGSQNHLHQSKTFNGILNKESNSEASNYNHDMTKYGQYTHKLYRMASKLPWFVRKLLPKDSTLIHEKSWNMYPNVKTVLTNEYFKSNIRIELDTITREVKNGNFEHNVHKLTQEQLEKREIVYIDIAEKLSNDNSNEDPSIFKSKKTGRGPLVPGEWYKNHQPLICCYKLVTAEIKLFGLQTKCENYLKTMYKQLFAIFHRQVFCWIDKWHGITIEQVRKIEYELAKELLSKIDQGELSRNQLVNE